MVKIKLFITFYMVIIMSSCGVNRRVGIDEGYVLTPKESFDFTMFNLIEAYTGTYARVPTSARDFIIFIERMNESDRLSFSQVYKYLKKKEKKLVVTIGTHVVDTTKFENVIFLYEKSTPDRKFSVSYHGPCESSVRLAHMTFFDEQGYFFESDSLRTTLLAGLRDINEAHAHSLQEAVDTYDAGGYYQRVIIEYTRDGLKNLCMNKNIDLSQSDFFAETYEHIKIFATANNISRIITPSFIDKSVVYE